MASYYIIYCKLYWTVKQDIPNGTSGNGTRSPMRGTLPFYKLIKFNNALYLANIRKQLQKYSSNKHMFTLETISYIKTYDTNNYDIKTRYMAYLHYNYFLITVRMFLTKKI